MVNTKRIMVEVKVKVKVMTLSSCSGRLKVGETQLSRHGSTSIRRHRPQTLQVNLVRILVAVHILVAGGKHLISAEDNVRGSSVGVCCQLVQPIPGNGQ